jgi:hypothetical protein
MCPTFLDARIYSKVSETPKETPLEHFFQELPNIYPSRHVKSASELCPLFTEFLLCQSQSQSQSYFTTDGQSVSMSWCRAQFGTFDQRYYFFFCFFFYVVMVFTFSLPWHTPNLFSSAES